MNSKIFVKKFNLKKSRKPKHIIANSEKNLLFFEKFVNFLNKKIQTQTERT